MHPNQPARSVPRSGTLLPWLVAAVAAVVAVVAIVLLLVRSHENTGNAAAPPVSATTDPAVEPTDPAQSPTRPAPATFGVTEGDFSTAEEAVRFAITAYAAGDTTAALGAFAIAGPAENFDMVAYLERMHAVVPNGPPDPADPYTAHAFVAWRLEQALYQLRAIGTSLTLPEDLQDARTRAVQLGDRSAEEMVSDLRIGDLTGLTVDQVAPVTSADGPRYDDLIANQLTIYGADEFAEVGVLVGFDGQSWLGGATLVRYGDRWLVLSLNSATLGTDTTGGLTPIDPADFERALSGN